MKLLVFILSLCIPIMGRASYYQPILEEAVGKSELVVVGDFLDTSSRKSIYIYPVLILKGAGKNIVEICADRSHMDGYRPVGNKRAFYFLKKEDGCYYGVYGYYSEIPVFDMHDYQGCILTEILRDFSEYKIENVSRILKYFDVNENILYPRKNVDCRNLKR